jgi:hypothetical protein
MGQLTAVRPSPMLGFAKDKEAPHMNTALTLVIALRGIATGIGAIWAALLARRQAQVTERSLTEQNERSRLALEYDLLTRLQDRFASPHLSTMRRATAKHPLDNAFVEGDVVGAQSLNSAAIEVCSFYEEVGELLRFGLLRVESVRIRYSVAAQAYWMLCEPGIEKLREAWRDPALFEEFERLIRLTGEPDRERGVKAPTQELLRQVMEAEAVRGQEAPTTGVLLVY